MLKSWSQRAHRDFRLQRAFRCFSTPSLPPTTHSILSLNQDEANLQIHGWVHSIRRQKHVTFLAVGDGSDAKTVQAVVNADAGVAIPENLTYGASIRLTGNWTSSPAAGQEMELQVKQIEVLGECDGEMYPIQHKTMSLEHLRDHGHLRARYPRFAAALRVRDAITSSVHEFFKRNDFVNIHTPVITSNDCEGAGETFQISPTTPPHSDLLASSSTTHTSAAPHFFGHPAYLTVSHQLHLEALNHSLPRVYSLSPCFRAEGSQTARHLAEFYMLEAEVAFVDKLDSVMSLVECLIRDVKESLSSNREDLDLLWKGNEDEYRGVMDLDEEKWMRISYSDVVDELSAPSLSGKFKTPPIWGSPLRSEHERFIVEHLSKNKPVFVTHYPASAKPFYMLRSPSRETVENFDLLLPRVLEVAGGSLRAHSYDELRSHPDFPGKEMDWYLDLRKYGSAPHGGFGLGLDRLVCWLTGTESVKDVVPMPRWAGRMLM